MPTKMVEEAPAAAAGVAAVPLTSTRCFLAAGCLGRKVAEVAAEQAMRRHASDTLFASYGTHFTSRRV